MAIKISHPRWRDVVPYFSALPLDEKRSFYAKAIKFMLDSNNWDDDLRVPRLDDHVNMRHMLLAFNGHTRVVMQEKATPDIVLQWEVVRCIRKGVKRRVRKRQISRVTYEFMQLIRMCHPLGRVGREGPRHRVTCMPEFQRELKRTFI